ncbi:MAG: PspC domain-containing protein [Caldisericia bacterium]|nr:PspC domain-containing protein [Caldisericia bacterium]MDD4613867.1 PspC domain-containing protein [Caldisericia bacterium]
MLYRSYNDRIVAGIIGGVAEFLHVPSTLLRIVFVVILFASYYFLRFFGFFLLSVLYLMGIFSIPISGRTDPTAHKVYPSSSLKENEIQGEAREIPPDDL